MGEFRVAEPIVVVLVALVVLVLVLVLVLVVINLPSTITIRAQVENTCNTYEPPASCPLPLLI